MREDLEPEGHGDDLLKQRLGAGNPDLSVSGDKINKESVEPSRGIESSKEDINFLLQLVRWFS